ncbi:hypothetical protein BDV95DRAFT_278115 [Massariosphaeria phaeospora]|uniref:Secreted protein n=1 Tax=Massariosphaeria phaeospora TaxID=100035 RepID=A0A7C8IF17_9PLEO|nr:hypothetical protein BDV95DRAFT_278115 [Massariosphaeria phaeospora]
MSFYSMFPVCFSALLPSILTSQSLFRSAIPRLIFAACRCPTQPMPSESASLHSVLDDGTVRDAHHERAQCQGYQHAVSNTRLSLQSRVRHAMHCRYQGTSHGSQKSRNPRAYSASIPRISAMISHFVEARIRIQRARGQGRICCVRR